MSGDDEVRGGVGNAALREWFMHMRQALTCSTYAVDGAPDAESRGRLTQAQQKMHDALALMTPPVSPSEPGLVLEEPKP